MVEFRRQITIYQSIMYIHSCIATGVGSGKGCEQQGRSVPCLRVVSAIYKSISNVQTALIYGRNPVRKGWCCGTGGILWLLCLFVTFLGQVLDILQPSPDTLINQALLNCRVSAYGMSQKEGAVRKSVAFHQIPPNYMENSTKIPKVSGSSRVNI